jgi:hypothetical protein
VSAYFKDAAGNTSRTASAAFEVDRTAPSRPDAPAAYVDDVGAEQSPSSVAGLTDDARPGILVGKNLQDVPSLYVDGKRVAATYDASAGTLTPDLPVSDGKHVFAYTLTDAAGNESFRSNGLTITIDATATSNATVGLAVSILGDTNNDGWVNASELGTASMLTSKATFNASAVAGDKILFKATNNGVALPDQILTLTAKDIANKYVMVNFAKPAEGTVQTVTAAYMDAAGNVAKDAALKDSATLDTVATAPVIEKVETVWWNDEFGGMKYHKGEKVEALPVPNGGTMQSGWPQIYGKAEPGSSVDIYKSNSSGGFDKLDTETAKEDGTFHYNYYLFNGDMLKVDGETHTFKVAYKDAAGNVSAFSNSWVLTIDSTAPAVPVITVTDDVGEFKGGIANNGVTDDATPTISGAGTAGNKVIIYDNDTLNSVATITVGADGKWSYTPAALADGSKHSFSVREMDAARNFSDYSTAVTFTVDTTAPLAPSAAPTSYKDDVGSYTTATSKEGTTDDNKPGINIGKGLTDTPNLYVDGAKVTSVYDATNGTLTPASALGDGSHTFAYSLSDKAGNESGKSGSLTFAVDASGPTATVSVSDSYLVPGQTALVKMVFSEKVTGLDVSDISAPNGTISDLASADGGKTWTATFTPNANVNGVDAKITLGTGYTDVLGNAGSAASSATYKVQTSYGVSLGAGVSVAETSTSYETRYKSFVSDTQAFGTERWFNNFAKGHDYILEYKLSDGSTGKIDISDDEGSVDSSQKLLVDSTNKVTVTDVRLWNYTCAGIWKSVSGTSSTMDLEDDAGILALGLFADWHDAQVHVETQSYLKAYTTTVYSTDYSLNFSNSATFKQETPNACYKISLSGGSNYQLLDASGTVLQTGAGTYQATMAQIDAGLKVHVNAGGTAPSGVSAAFVSTASPLVLDLDGDGVQTVSVEQGVRFDLTGKGAQPVGWMERQDGLLAIDLNHNGLIDSGAELFGNATALSDGQKAADGWAALAALDSNADGHIDARDAHFADLRLWVDADGDAVTDAGELRTLAEAGVTSLNVAYARSASVQNGNLLDGSGSFTKADGSVGAMTDVWFQTAPAEVPGPVKAAGAAPQGTLNLSDVLASSAQDAVDGVDSLWMNQHSAPASVQAMLDATLLAAQIHCA